METRLRERGVKLRSVQIQWSLLSPGVAQAQELLDLCQSLDIEVLAYSPLAFGVLGCKPGQTPRPSTWVRQRLFRRLLPDSLQIRQLLAAIAQERGVSMVQVALNWCRATGTSPIPGLRSPRQAMDVAAALTWQLSDAECFALTQARERCIARMPSNPFQSR
jgi:pyridoxine 4-dehydrogenase